MSDGSGRRKVLLKHLSYYPQDIIDSYLKHNPGLIPPTYQKGINSWEDHVESLREYFAKKEKNPRKTDISCFFDVMYNILIKGQRSK